MSDYYIGIDVGTGSARAGLFDEDGTLLAAAKKPISIWKEAGDIVEQSSNDIWQAICHCTRNVLAEAKITDPQDVKGVGFDATCSLVVLDPSGNPLPVGPSEDAERNVIVWMDHRAIEQAHRINSGKYAVLNYVGGTISPEMETPKLLWLKENRPETFASAGHFMDLADFLTWRATGSTSRSVCTVTCKWTYMSHDTSWDESYFRTIGLGALAEDGFARIGDDIQDIAAPLGGGLTAAAAEELGLFEGTKVGASLIDAHSGGVGTFAGRLPDGSTLDPEKQMAFIMGTSACAMALSKEPLFVDGVWGPYYGAMVPGYWLLEGGQSAYGAALDFLVASHPAFPTANAEAEKVVKPLLVYLEEQALATAGSMDKVAFLARDVHVVPEYLGNRAPHADPEATAVISGLTLDASLSNLVSLYVAGLCGLCYGTRQIVDAAKGKGHGLETLVLSGGAAQSALFRRILADTTGLSVALPDSEEPVLLGGAIIGAVAAGRYASVVEAAGAMSRFAEVINPDQTSYRGLHAAKYDIFCKLQALNRSTRAQMKALSAD
ncbi:FGGY-family carbohydrate kinase [uncultured Cohaesibacter sp.]|uniref:FGGY-family carbohydrate kinase n=1 Tax=uncultured Cohaesibacter sp. TaxID=1002546 RepID=UPI0029C86713|nr:FGGY-family carbohydrate kinase [uncultured Cohaesibacter sp.]